MDVNGGIPSGASYHDLIAVLIPFQYRSGGKTKPSTYFGGNRHLSLRGEPRPCDGHESNITTVIDLRCLIVIDPIDFVTRRILVGLTDRGRLGRTGRPSPCQT